jgi:hypothetical protein
MQKSCHGYIVGKQFSNLGTQKGADSSNKATTNHHFFFHLHTPTNMQNSYWEMQKNIKITTSIAFVVRFSLLFQVHKKRQNLWKENFTAIDVNSEELESDEHSSGC